MPPCLLIKTWSLFFINCCTFIWVYIYIHKYNLLCLYDVAQVYIFRTLWQWIINCASFLGQTSFLTLNISQFLVDICVRLKPYELFPIPFRVAVEVIMSVMALFSSYGDSSVGETLWEQFPKLLRDTISQQSVCSIDSYNLSVLFPTVFSEPKVQVLFCRCILETGFIPQLHFYFLCCNEKHP